MQRQRVRCQLGSQIRFPLRPASRRLTASDGLNRTVENGPSRPGHHTPWVWDLEICLQRLLQSWIVVDVVSRRSLPLEEPVT